MSYSRSTEQTSTQKLKHRRQKKQKLAIKKDMSKSTKEHLKDYEDYLRIHNFSRSTVQAYKLGLRQFLEFG